MADIFLNPNEDFGPLGGENSVFGSTGEETVLVDAGGNFTIDATTERVELPGDVADFTFQTVGTGVEVRDADTGDLVATFNDLSNSPTVVFGDGATTLTAPSGVGEPAQLGGTDIPIDAASAVTPDTIDETDISRTADGVEPPPPTDGEEIEGTAGNDLITPDSDEFPTTDGDDTIRGLEGGDTIDGGAGADSVQAGAGDDTLIYDSDDALLDGGETPDAEDDEDNDTLVIGEADLAGNTIGSDEEDISLANATNIETLDITASQGDNTLVLFDQLILDLTGDDNELTILANNASDTIDLRGVGTGQSFNITIVTPDQASIPTILDPEGDSEVTVDIVTPEDSFGDDVVEGTDGDDEFTFTQDGDDSFSGLDGDDVLTVVTDVFDGNDTFDGGEGSNTLIFEGGGEIDLDESNLANVTNFQRLEFTNVSNTSSVLTDEDSSITLNDTLVGQLVRGQATSEDDRLTLASDSDLEVGTFDVGSDDVITLEGNAENVLFTLADVPDAATNLQGNIVSLSDFGSPVSILGGDGNDSISGGVLDDYIVLLPKLENNTSGNNVATGDLGDDTIVGGSGQDIVRGDQGDDRLIFGIDGRETFEKTSRLNANDTIEGGDGEDTIALEAQTILDSESEFSNVSGVEVIELNGNGADIFTIPAGDFNTPVYNEIQLLDSLVETSDGGLTIDATTSEDNRGFDAVALNEDGTSPGRLGEVSAPFTLVDPNEEIGTVQSDIGNVDTALDDSVDVNAIDLTELSQGVNVTIQGGDAHELVIFDDESFDGEHLIEGGDGGLFPQPDNSRTGVGIPDRLGVQPNPTEANNAVAPFSAELLAGEAAGEPIRLARVDAISNFDTLELRTSGSELFTADETDFNNITGFEEILLSSTVGATPANYTIVLTNEIVRQLTKTDAASGTNTGDPANLTISLDSIDEIIGLESNPEGNDLDPDSTVELVTSSLTDSLLSVTVLNPNGVNVDVGENPNGNVQVRSEDYITSAELASALELAQTNADQLVDTRNGVITQDYDNAQVNVTVGHNLRGIAADLNFTSNGTNHSIVTGDGDFIITTAAGADTIFSGDGDDLINAGPGNDQIIINGGADTINGGAGTDTINFSVTLNPEADTEGVTVDLEEGEAGEDELSSIEGVIGTSGNDTLTGDANANILTGLGSSDSLSGGDGVDTLVGDGTDANPVPDGADFATSPDNDAIPAGDDTLVGGTGDDQLFGNAGDDTFIWNNGDGSDSIEGGADTDTVQVNGAPEDADSFILNVANPNNFNFERLNLGQFTLTGGDVEVFEINGGGGDDTIEAGTTANVEITFSGEAGDDSLVAGASAETLDGGEDTDTVSYANSGAAVDVDLSSSGEQSGGFAEGDVLVDIENLGGSANNDTLAGDDNDNVINGNAGNDVITGQDGNDTLLGAAGSDTIAGGAGDDAINGGPGADRLIGGEGADIITLAAAAQSTAAAPDTIAGFVAGEDQIDLSAIEGDLFFGDNVTLDEGVLNGPGFSIVLEDLEGELSAGDLIGVESLENEAPVVTDVDFEVAETAANGDVVGTVTAEDPDGTVEAFAITEGNIDADEDGTNPFAIDDSGEITVADSVDIVANSPEDPFSLTVEVTDDEGTTGTGTVGIDVIEGIVDEDPVVTDADFEVLETAANGDAVGTVVAEDPDGGDIASFTITEGNTDADGDGTSPFAIDDNGEITVADSDDIVADSPEDPFSLTVEATDDEGATATGTIGIDVIADDDNGGNIISLPAGTTDPVTGTADSDIFTFDYAAAFGLEDNTQIPVQDFATAAPTDLLQVDLPDGVATGATTLDQLNGEVLPNGETIAVQSNVITNQTDVTFGPDANGDLIALSLEGIVDPTTVAVEVI